MKIFFKSLLVIAIVAIIVYVFYFLYQKNQESPIVYETDTAKITNIIKKTVATGSVVPRKEIEIKSQLSGIIEEIYIEPGDMVKKGQLLSKVKIIPNMVNLNNAESRLNRANINYEHAKLLFDRQKELYEKYVIAEVEYQQVETNFREACEELNSAENNLQLVKEGVSKKSGSGTNTLIRSTIDGMVLDVPVKEGNQVIESNTFNPGTTIATIANMNNMIFMGEVDESEVGKIHIGMDLILSVGAIENVKYNAKLEYISPKGIEKNGAIQFQIKAAVQLNDTNFIRAGYSANADIVLSRKDSVLAINESLLLFDKDTVFVEIETAPQIFEKNIIKVGISDGINIEVTSGLKIEDKIKIHKAIFTSQI
ncbi:MAG: efflux RND transporter periplasmic adaptor subunit [Bacteroidetes bacterium]|jgi:HlyD family secretion protein|nr:efflux RND transporter periplasmic adaptor subunit [Bacteroidota bacterium]MBT6685020.1 efflux RND transporter periplasmic adaptor subunit [Bacteroidota bacterium]MBT7143098.1 efflux RND transporter periplasmic adaptor subunit [Bacteroidota bacterium]MBT7491489.1 efflux RND transporter periplasmic adaptor subunit [Bacteroidota bacterium]